MATENARIDIGDAPDLLRLAEEVKRTGRPRVLSRNDEDLVVVSPARARRPKPVSDEDLAAFRAAAGSWKNFDTKTFLKHVRESRRSSRPPVKL
jgi:hypothetical protein